MLGPLVPAPEAFVMLGRPAPGVLRSSWPWGLAPTPPSRQALGSGPAVLWVEGSVGTIAVLWPSLFPGCSEEGPSGILSGLVLGVTPLQWGSGHSVLGSLTASVPSMAGMPGREETLMVTFGDMALAGGGVASRVGDPLSLCFLESPSGLDMWPSG